MFWLVICKLMRIRIRFRIQLITLMQIWMRIRILFFYADADPGNQNDADKDPDEEPDPQHCSRDFNSWKIWKIWKAGCFLWNLESGGVKPWHLALRKKMLNPAVDYLGFKLRSATVKYFLLTGKPGRFYFWYRRLQILDVLQPGGLVLNKYIFSREFFSSNRYRNIIKN